MQHRISTTISYIPQNTNPLSADIGIIQRDDETWLFDVGNGLSNIEGLNDEYIVVLSHFHLDHIGNLEKLKIKQLYVSKETYKHLSINVKEYCVIVIVESDIYLDGLHIFNIPSSHCKGSLGLEVDQEYAFLGDSLYCKYSNSQQTYNVQLLNEEITKLKSLKANNFLLSHKEGLIISKDAAIAKLNAIYQRRQPKETSIVLGETND